MRNLYCIYLCWLLIIPIALMAQGSSKNERTHQWHQQARVALSKGEIEKGVVLYEKIIKQNKNQAEYYWLLDDIFKHTKQHPKRIALLQKAIKNKKTSFPEQTIEKLGLAYFDSGNYDEAVLTFKQLKQTPTIKRYIAQCETAKTLRNNPIETTISVMGNQINTPYDNIWPGITADEEVFSFTVVEGKTTPFSNLYSIQEDIYQSYKLNNNWQQANRLPSPINTPDNEGSQHFSADGRYMFFVGCNRKDGKGSCDIYYSINNGGTFSTPINPGEPLNTSFWESTPSFSACGNFIYFASNRPGGIGGKDIWQCQVSILPSGKLSFFNVLNLGERINTNYDEISPFIHSDNMHLYFSSTGHSGMGGFDVFLATKDSISQWNAVKNIGYPINTASDEIGFVVAASGTKAYLSSNQHADTQHLNKQLYEITLPESLQPKKMKTVKGIVLDKKTKQPLQANIEVFDFDTQKTISRTISDTKTGLFTAIIPSENQVGLFAKKQQYLVSSERIDSSSSAFYTIELQKIEKGTSFVLRNIYFDFDSYELLTNSYAELNRLIEFLQLNASVQIAISGHTDNLGSNTYNIALSTQRARSVYNYLVQKGIDSSRLRFEGKGAENPIEDNNTENGRSKNRRIEFIIQ
jgi:outer membrane protein OmpA-like peptidoglycan-associated protein